MRAVWSPPVVARIAFVGTSERCERCATSRRESTERARSVCSKTRRLEGGCQLTVGCVAIGNKCLVEPFMFSALLGSSHIGCWLTPNEAGSETASGGTADRSGSSQLRAAACRLEDAPGRGRVLFLVLNAIHLDRQSRFRSNSAVLASPFATKTTPEAQDSDFESYRKDAIMARNKSKAETGRRNSQSKGRERGAAGPDLRPSLISSRRKMKKEDEKTGRVTKTKPGTDFSSAPWAAMATKGKSDYR